jgi:simple sugar transport system permease protein
MFGAKAPVARASGVQAGRLTLTTMFFSGAIAGVVGAIQVLGVHYRLIDGALSGPGYAWTGLMAAILANNSPIGVVAASLFFAAIQTGAAGMERATSVPSEISFVVQATMILLVASRSAFRRERGRKGR